MPPKPPYFYAILGAGRQGTAAAYDLARFGDARRILLADSNIGAAQNAAERVNNLNGKQVAEPHFLDVTDPLSVRETLGPVDAALSAVPYVYNLEITRAAIESNTHLCDLGGHTDLVLTQLALDEEARQSGISIVPDCGMGPGLINTLAAYVIGRMDDPREIYIFDAGLPQDPQPPWNYSLTFHVNGLTNEMDGQAIYLRDGKIARVDTLTEPEMIEFPPLGRLEADVTSGGTSTAPWTYEGRLQRYENKTLRYPGHFEWLRAFKALGLFSEKPVSVNGQPVPPRSLFHALLEPQIVSPGARDLAIIRVVGKGRHSGQPSQLTLDLIDNYDEKTGFTAMERLTGWHCAIMMGFQARGQVIPGARPVELAVAPHLFLDELRKRNIHFEIY